MDLAGDGHPWLQIPAPYRLVAERSAASAFHLGLGVLADQPGQESTKLLSPGHVGSSSHRRGSAGPATPPLGASRRPTVLHQRITAYQTRRRIRGKVHE